MPSKLQTNWEIRLKERACRDQNIIFRPDKLAVGIAESTAQPPSQAARGKVLPHRAEPALAPPISLHREAEQSRRLPGAAWPRGEGSGGGQGKDRAPCAQCLLHGSPVRICSSYSLGRARWGAAARLQGWTPSRVGRKSPRPAQLFHIPLLCISCLLIWSINQWNAGIMCYLLLMFSPKCLALCRVYYGCSKKCSGQRIQEQGMERGRKERGRIGWWFSSILRMREAGVVKGFDNEGRWPEFKPCSCLLPALLFWASYLNFLICTYHRALLWAWNGFWPIDGLEQSWQTTTCGQPDLTPIFINKVLLEPRHAHHVCIAHSCFHTTGQSWVAETGLMALKARNIDYLDLYGKSSPTKPWLRTQVL